GKAGAVARRRQEPDAPPGRGERACLGLAVADHRRDEEIRVVERGAEGMRQDVAQLAPLVDGAGSRDADVAGDAAGSREAPEEAAQTGDVARDLGVDLRVRPLEVDVREE